MRCPLPVALRIPIFQFSRKSRPDLDTRLFRFKSCALVTFLFIFKRTEMVHLQPFWTIFTPSSTCPPPTLFLTLFAPLSPLFLYIIFCPRPPLTFFLIFTLSVYINNFHAFFFTRIHLTLIGNIQSVNSDSTCVNITTGFQNT